MRVRNYSPESPPLGAGLRKPPRFSRRNSYCSMYPRLDDLRFISQVWSFEDCEDVEFIQLNVFGTDLINDL